MNEVNEGASGVRTLALPLYAFWTAACAVGIPTSFFAIGFLAEKGHQSLFGLPSALLRTSPEYVFYQGALFLLFTLRNIAWHWTVLVASVALIAFYSLGHRIRGTKLMRVVLTGDVVVAAVIAIASICILISTHVIALQLPLASATPQHDIRFDESIPTLFGAERGSIIRDAVYRIISYGNLLVTLGLLWLIRVRYEEPRPMSRILRSSAFVLCLISLVNWPLCYGRLLVSYERPMISIGNEGWTGYVLNPQADVWTIWRPDHSMRSYEIKSIPPFVLLRYEDIVSVAIGLAASDNPPTHHVMPR